jgi:hypothetical protein
MAHFKIKISAQTTFLGFLLLDVALPGKGVNYWKPQNCLIGSLSNFFSVKVCLTCRWNVGLIFDKKYFLKNRKTENVWQTHFFSTYSLSSTKFDELPIEKHLLDTYARKQLP